MQGRSGSSIRRIAATTIIVFEVCNPILVVLAQSVVPRTTRVLDAAAGLTSLERESTDNVPLMRELDWLYTRWPFYGKDAHDREAIVAHLKESIIFLGKPRE